MSDFYSTHCLIGLLGSCEVVFDYLCDLFPRLSDFYSNHCLLGLLGGCEVVFDYLCDLLSRMSDFYSTHCLLGLLGGVCSCEVVFDYVTYFHGWVISILLTAYLACWAAYAAVRLCLIMWPIFTDEWFLFYSLLTWLAGLRKRLWGCVWLFMWPTFTDEWFLFYSLLTWLAGRRMRLWGEVVFGRLLMPLELLPVPPTNIHIIHNDHHSYTSCICFTLKTTFWKQWD